jgi:hypothetical protein
MSIHRSNKKPGRRAGGGGIRLMWAQLRHRASSIRYINFVEFPFYEG